MNESYNRNALVLKIEYHRQMSHALAEDATSKSQHIFSKEEHEQCQALASETSVQDSLKMAASYHRQKFEDYLKEFQSRFPQENYEALYLEREDWMGDEIWNKATPFQDPQLQSKEDQAPKNT